MISEAHFSEIFLNVLYRQGYPSGSVKRQFKISNNRIVDFVVLDNVTQKLLALIECVLADRSEHSAIEQIKDYVKFFTNIEPSLFVVFWKEGDFDVYTTMNAKNTFYHIPELPDYEFLKAKVYRESIKLNLDEINAELIKYLAKHPSKMYDLSPRKFEELVAELFRDMGYNVYLTPPTRDGGRDIIAAMNIFPNKEFLTIIECKKFSPHNKLGMDIVERFIYTIREKDKANTGFIATTSYFSNDVKNLQNKYKWLLSLNDFDNLKEWLCNYGQWTNLSRSEGIWLPNSPLKGQP